MGKIIYNTYLEKVILESKWQDARDVVKRSLMLQKNGITQSSMLDYSTVENATKASKHITEKVS
jgi:hypothetical protein